MGATKSSETLVSYRNTAKRNSPEDQDLNFWMKKEARKKERQEINKETK
jgi:hypothetical protein